FDTLHEFILSLLDTNDQQLSAQVSRMLGAHGHEILDLIREKRPDIANSWAHGVTNEIYQAEANKLAKLLRPEAGQDISNLLEKFSLEELLTECKFVAPNFCSVLDTVGHDQANPSERRDHSLVLITVVCMLATSRSERSNEFQTVLGLYFLACGTSKSQFAVLHHSGLTSSYTKAILDLKRLSEELKNKAKALVRKVPCMISWDNINIAFHKAEQRHDNKNHFDNGTTATLIPLYGVEKNLPLDLLPQRTSRRQLLDITPVRDTLPSPVQAASLEKSFLWHIEDILLDAYPIIGRHFPDKKSPPPVSLPIPLHKTEVYPLPAMFIDESSINGTINVFETIFGKSLGLTDNEIKDHGVFLCAGDQLSVSLLDKVSGIRRDDIKLADNFSNFLKGQIGLFHVKMAGTRMILNEHWGKANSKSPWCLWLENTLLARKPISAGWKAKQLPPFRPTFELIVDLSLPAHVLNGCELLCGNESLAKWAASIKDYEDVRTLVGKVKNDLFSAVRVEELRALPEDRRDIVLENIILFNRDAIILRELSMAVRAGDVGRVTDVLAFWMVMFRGTGSMPKYADALFHLLKDLKTMAPELRHAFLMNWLVNTTGLKDGFKEIDLLQEHQNFWAKIVYLARGSNSSWQWISMVSVCVFYLRDVMQKLQLEYKIPHNGISHTTPSTTKDIAAIRKYLSEHAIQTYNPTRTGNEHATPVRDLMESGGAYTWTASAFRNFRPENYRTKTTATKKTSPASEPSANAHNDDDDADGSDTDEGSEPDTAFPASIFDLDSSPDITGDDLGLDRDCNGQSVDIDALVRATKDLIRDM
ncbi:hypothetical protein BD410DRAFT_735116, partial [Rickenella mellea]